MLAIELTMLGYNRPILLAAVAAPVEASTSGRRDKKSGYAAGEWDIAKMAPKLKGQA